MDGGRVAYAVEAERFRHGEGEEGGRREEMNIDSKEGVGWFYRSMLLVAARVVQLEVSRF